MNFLPVCAPGAHTSRQWKLSCLHLGWAPKSGFLCDAGQSFHLHAAIIESWLTNSSLPRRCSALPRIAGLGMLAAVITDDGRGRRTVRHPFSPLFAQRGLLYADHRPFPTPWPTQVSRNTGLTGQGLPSNQGLVLSDSSAASLVLHAD